MDFSWLKGKAMSYVLFGLAVIMVALNFLGFLSEPIMLTLVGLFGFSGVSALRAFINSQGWKTYFSAAMGVLGIVGQVLLPGAITPEVLMKWLSFWGMIAGVTTAQGVAKAQKT